MLLTSELTCLRLLSFAGVSLPLPFYSRVRKHERSKESSGVLPLGFFVYNSAQGEEMRTAKLRLVSTQTADRWRRGIHSVDFLTGELCPARRQLGNATSKAESNTGGRAIVNYPALRDSVRGTSELIETKGIC